VDLGWFSQIILAPCGERASSATLGWRHIVIVNEYYFSATPTIYDFRRRAKDFNRLSDET
jgi:hypothetical protein